MKFDAFRGTLSLSTTSVDHDSWLNYSSFAPRLGTCLVSHSERYGEVVGQLNLFSELESNWDGYGGMRISESAIEQARSLVWAQLYSYANLKLPEITPTPNGTLLLEWQGRAGEAAVEIGNTRVSGFIRSDNAPPLCIAGETSKLSAFLPAFIAPFLSPEASKTTAITPVDYQNTANG